MQGHTVQRQTVQNIGMEGINLLGIVQRKGRILDLDVRGSRQLKELEIKTQRLYGGGGRCLKSKANC